MRWTSSSRRASGIFRPKMRYAHQGGSNPPLIIMHGSALDKVPDGYTRYLEKTFCEAFKLQGTPLRVEFRPGKNPFADKKPQAANRKRRARSAWLPRIYAGDRPVMAVSAGQQPEKSSKVITPQLRRRAKK